MDCVALWFDDEESETPATKRKVLRNESDVLSLSDKR